MNKVKDLTKPRIGDHCTVCGGAPRLIGIFQPDDAQAWGAPVGKTRFIRYCLCEGCYNLPGIQGRVEKILEADLSFGGGYVC